MVETLAGLDRDFDEGRRRVIDVGGKDVAVFRVDDRYYAFENSCVHSGGPVGEGILIGKVETILSDDRQVLGEVFSEDCLHLVCPWHGWEYDIETGEAAGNPRFKIQKFVTRVEEDRVYVIS